MSLHRKALRDAAFAALAAHPRLFDAEPIRSWAQGVEERSLPALGVLTPGETSQSAARDVLARRVELVVAFKRRGGIDLLDDLDADAEAIETALAPALNDHAVNWHLTQTQTNLDGAGGTRVGVIVLRFSVLIHTTREE